MKMNKGIYIVVVILIKLRKRTTPRSDLEMDILNNDVRGAVKL